MAWDGKIVGAGIGAAAGGPAGAIIGGLLGGLFDVLFGDDDNSANWSMKDSSNPATVNAFTLRHGFSGPHGPGMLITFKVHMPGGFPEECVAVARPRVGESGITSKLNDYTAVEDGSIMGDTVLEVEGKAEDGNASIYIPYAAFRPDFDQAFSVDVFVVTAGAQVIASDTFDNCEWVPYAVRETLNLLAVLSDAAVAMVQRAGPLTRDDVRVIREQLTEIFELDKIGLETLRLYLKKANGGVHYVNDIANRLQLTVAEEEWPYTVRFLYTIANVRGGIHPQKHAFIVELVSALGISKGVLEEIRQEFGKDLSIYYATLELEPGAALEDVKKAYRRMASDYHPDRVQTLPKGFQDYATEKFRDIREAYEVLRRELAK